MRPNDGLLVVGRSFFRVVVFGTGDKSNKLYYVYDDDYNDRSECMLSIHSSSTAVLFGQSYYRSVSSILRMNPLTNGKNNVCWATTTNS
jgi:hypothetical protein